MMPQGTPPQDSPWGNFWEYFWQQMSQPNPMWNTPGAGSNISLNTGGGVPVSWNNWYWNPAAPPTPWNAGYVPPPAAASTVTPPVASVTPPPVGTMPPGPVPPGTVAPGTTYSPTIAPGAPPLPPPPPAPAPTTNYPAGTNADGSQNWFYWTGPTGSPNDPQNEWANTLGEYSNGNWQGAGWYGSNGAYSSSLEGIQGTGADYAVQYDPNYGSGNFVGGGTRHSRNKQGRSTWGEWRDNLADMAEYYSKIDQGKLETKQGGTNQSKKALRYKRTALTSHAGLKGKLQNGPSYSPAPPQNNPNWMGQLVSFNP